VLELPGGDDGSIFYPQGTKTMNLENVFTVANYVVFGLIIVAVLFWWFRFSLSRRWNQHKKTTVDKWQAEGIEFVRGPAGGQFGGLESMGVKRVLTGIGLAMMTTKDLRITRATPPGWWIVTYKQIKGVSIRWKFMGEVSKKTPFIVVRFVKDGQPDKLGFRVNNYEEWAKELAEAAGVPLKDQEE
jgi:hypothetical protein